MTADTHVAFVAGATGYVGRYVVQVLRSRGIETFAHVRFDSPRLGEWRKHFAALGAETCSAPWESAAMHAELRRLQPSHVFALLGTTSARAVREGSTARAQYERVDYGMTATLLGAAEAAGHVERFVYLSAAGVNPGTGNPYLAVRVRIEKLLHDSALPSTIVRPSFITGPDRGESRPTERIAAKIADAFLRVPGAFGAHDFRNRWRSMTGAKLAEAIVRAAVNPACANAVLHGDELHRLL